MLGLGWEGQGMSAACWGPDTDSGKGWSLLKIDHTLRHYYQHSCKKGVSLFESLWRPTVHPEHSEDTRTHTL